MDTELTGDQRITIVKVGIAVKMMYIVVFMVGGGRYDTFSSVQKALLEFHFNPGKSDLFKRFAIFLNWEGNSYLQILLKGYLSEKDTDLFPGMIIIMDNLLKISGIKKAAEDPDVIAGVVVICTVILNLILHYVNATLIYKLAKLYGCFSDHALRISLVLVFSTTSMYHVGFFPDSWYLFSVLMAMCKLRESQLAHGHFLNAPLINYLQIVVWFAISSATIKGGVFNCFYLLPFHIPTNNKANKLEGQFKLRFVHLAKSILGVAAVITPWIIFTWWSYTKFCFIDEHDSSIGKCNNGLLFAFSSLFWSHRYLKSPWYLWWLCLMICPVVFQSLRSSSQSKQEIKNKKESEVICSHEFPNQKWITVWHLGQSLLSLTESNRSMAVHFYYYFMIDEHQAYHYKSKSNWQSYCWIAIIASIYTGPVLYTCQIAEF